MSDVTFGQEILFILYVSLGTCLGNMLYELANILVVKETRRLFIKNILVALKLAKNPKHDKNDKTK